MTDPATELAKELVKQIPVKEVYSDTLSPAAKVTGSALEDAAKTLHLVLAPLQLTAALQDRFRRFIDRSIRQVPEEQRIAPAPQILGPVLEGIRYETEDTDLDNMFSQLLARASDKSRVSEAHPAYPQIIKQLSSDEAKVLHLLLEQRDAKFSRRQIAKWNSQTARFYDFEIVEETFPVTHLQYPENLDFYIDHLWSLGLAGLFKSDEKAIYAGGEQSGTDIMNEYRLTELGSRFMKAVAKKTASPRT